MAAPRNVAEPVFPRGVMSKWALILLFAGGSVPALAAVETTFQVNTAEDLHDAVPGNGICETTTPGVCTLRAAIEEANTTVGVTVRVPAATITLTIGTLVVQKTMTITGQGAERTTISGNDTHRVFEIKGAEPITATFQRLTIRDGKTLDHGGCVHTLVGHTLVMGSCVVTHCIGQAGGGIRSNGPVILTKTSITDCHAIDPFGSDNGGAIDLGGNATLTGCTLSGNSAGQHGGAIHVTKGTVDLVNTTVNGNFAGDRGGGIRVTVPGVVGLYSATVTENISGVMGGGLANATGLASSMTLLNSIVSNNYRGAGGQITFEDECAGLVSSTGSNILYAVDTGHCTVSGYAASVYPFAASLGDNGGPTKTAALLASSPAIDVGDVLGCTDRSGTVLTTDQRGVKRPVGAKCDLGAYERAPCGDVNGDGVVNVADVFFLISSLFAAGPIPPGLADVNNDDSVSVGDVFYLVNTLFAGGPAPSCLGT